jgi:3-oxoadipate enol-lactonase
MPVVRTEDADIYVEIEGDGSPVTVFAHGLTNNRNELAAFTPFLPGTKVRFDFRGHGRSSAPDDPSAFGFADLARDLDAVASAYGATVAVGTSLCAGAIANLIAREPGRFDRSVWLLPAGLDRRFGFLERYERVADELEGKTPEEALATVLSDPDRVAEYLRTPWREELDRMMWEHADPDGLARAIRGAISDVPVADRHALRRVDRPVLLICIEGDEIHPAELGRILHGLIPRSELLVYTSQRALFEALPELVPRVIAFVMGNV